MQIDVVHRHDLAVPAARRTALHAKARAEARLAQTDHRLLADAVERIAETDRGRRLTLACRRRVDRGDENELAVGALGQCLLNEAHADLRLVMAVRLDALGRNTEPIAGKLDDRTKRRRLRNLPIGLRFCGAVGHVPPWFWLAPGWRGSKPIETLGEKSVNHKSAHDFSGQIYGQIGLRVAKRRPALAPSARPRLIAADQPWRT